MQKGTRDSDVLIKRCYSFSEYAIFAEQKRSQESPTADNWQNVFSPHSRVSKTSIALIHLEIFKFETIYQDLLRLSQSIKSNVE